MQLAREVNQGLGLIFGRVLLGIGVENGTLCLAALGERNLVGGFGAVQHPGNDAIFALVNGGGTGLAAHGTVNGFNRHFASKSGGVRLPAGDLALAGLAGRRRGVQCLADGLKNNLGAQPEHRSYTGGS